MAERVAAQADQNAAGWPVVRGHARDLSPRTSYQRAAHFERAIVSGVLIMRPGGNFLARYLQQLA